MANLFDTAKALIETHGWVQKTLGAPDKGFCLFGALFTASHKPNFSYKEAKFAMDKGVTSAWNDAPGRTKEEVLDILTALSAEFK